MYWNQKTDQRRVNSRNMVISIFAAMIFIALMLTLSVAAAQDATPEATPGNRGIVCDSTLVLLWLVAEKEYGFSSSTTISLTDIERGQFAARFDAVAQVQTDQTMQDSGGSIAPTAPAEAELMATSDVTAQPEADGGLAQGAVLTPALIADEDPMCTQLRGELETFLLTQIDAELGVSQSGE